MAMTLEEQQLPREAPGGLPPGAPVHRRRPLPRPVKVGGSALVVLWLLLAAVGWLGCGAAESRESMHDRQLRGAAAAIRTGIERYAADHGHYPRDASAMRALVEPGKDYLRGHDRFLVSPWTQVPTRDVLALPPGLPGAAAIAHGTPCPELGLQLGNGRVPSDEPGSQLDYGALIYDYDPKSDVYVLYAVGQKRKIAVLADVESNYHGGP